MDMTIPPLKIKILLESNPPKSRILVRILAVPDAARGVPCGGCRPLVARHHAVAARSDEIWRELI